MSGETLIEQLKSVANFMRGMRFDPRLPLDIKQALTERVQSIDEVVENETTETTDQTSNDHTQA